MIKDESEVMRREHTQSSSFPYFFEDAIVDETVCDYTSLNCSSSSNFFFFFFLLRGDFGWFLPAALDKIGSIITMTTATTAVQVHNATASASDIAIAIAIATATATATGK